MTWSLRRRFGLVVLAVGVAFGVFLVAVGASTAGADAAAFNYDESAEQRAGAQASLDSGRGCLPVPGDVNGTEKAGGQEWDSVRSLASLVATEAGSSAASNTTRTGVVRNNPADWRRTRDVWDNAGLDDILSDANRKAIARGRSPVVDDAWVRHFPGDEALMGERISPHHLGGGPITAPLPASRHLDAHMPGGFRYNSGGPGATG